MKLSSFEKNEDLVVTLLCVNLMLGFIVMAAPPLPYTVVRIMAGVIFFGTGLTLWLIRD